MSDLFKCKECGKSTLTEESKALDLFSWCSQKCHDAWHAKMEKAAKIHRQWSEYMCGERKKAPKALAHLVPKYGWARDVEAEIADDEGVFHSDAVLNENREKGVRYCGKCGQAGHNARTCERRKAAAAAAPKKRRKKKRRKKRKTNVHGEKAKKVTTKKRKRSPRKKSAARRQYKCRLCDGMGHNARTCDRRPLEPGEFSSGEKVAKPKSIAARKMKKAAAPKQYKCGRCKQLGHNARTCKKERK